MFQIKISTAVKTVPFLFIVLLATTCLAYAQPFVPKGDMPCDTAGRLAAISFTINDKIYMGGGAFHKDFWEYDANAHTWTRKADIPGVSSSRCFGIGFSVNGKGYIGLGLDNYPNFVEKNDLWEYDPALDVWTRKADLPGLPRSGCAVFVVHNKAYVIAGSDTAATAYVHEYNPVTDAWTRKHDYPAGRVTNPMSFVVNGMPYITGGSIQTGATFTSTKKTFEYNASTDSWLPKADFPGMPREAGLALVHNGKAYVGLGAPPTYAYYFTDLYTYDPASDQWGLFLQTTDLGERAFLTSGIISGKAFVGAGWQFDGTEYYYKDWYQFTPSPSAVFTHPAPEIKCFPNPSNTSVRISLPSQYTPYSFRIYDMAGREKDSGMILNDGQIDISSLPNGNYGLAILLNDHWQTVQTITKY